MGIVRRIVIAAALCSSPMALPSQQPVEPTASSQQLVAEGQHNVLYEVDRAMQRATQAPAMQARESLRAIGTAFNWWGGDGVVWVTVLAWLVGRLLGWRRFAFASLRGVEGLTVASTLSSLLKGMAGRARPYVTPDEPWHWAFARTFTDTHYFSMPSGHTTSTFGFAIAVTMAVRLWPKAVRIPVSVVVCASGVLVAFARVYTNQHWFSDVIAGAILGTAAALLVTRLHARNPDSRFDRLLLGSEGSPAR